MWRTHRGGAISRVVNTERSPGRPLVTLNLCVMRRYYIGEGDLVHIIPCQIPKSIDKTHLALGSSRGNSDTCSERDTKHFCARLFLATGIPSIQMQTHDWGQFTWNQRGQETVSQGKTSSGRDRSFHTKPSYFGVGQGKSWENSRRSRGQSAVMVQN